MGFIAAAIGAIFATISITEIIVGALIATALSVLAQLIMMPSRKGQHDPFKPTQYTRREVGGTTPVIDFCPPGSTFRTSTVASPKSVSRTVTGAAFAPLLNRTVRHRQAARRAVLTCLSNVASGWPPLGQP